jgi:Lipase
MLGHNANLGHVDFYPNGGKAAQPGCDFRSDIIGGCSHGRSYRYFAESVEVKNGFMSFKCPSWDDYQKKNCEGDPVPMGESVPRNSNGTFYLETDSGPRFARFSKIL